MIARRERRRAASAAVRQIRRLAARRRFDSDSGQHEILVNEAADLGIVMIAIKAVAPIAFRCDKQQKDVLAFLLGPGFGARQRRFRHGWAHPWLRWSQTRAE